MNFIHRLLLYLITRLVTPSLTLCYILYRLLSKPIPLLIYNNFPLPINYYATFCQRMICLLSFITHTDTIIIFYVTIF